MKEKHLKEKEESKSADSDEEHADDDKRSIGSEHYSDKDVTSII